MLYKYLPSERIDVLDNLKVRFSPLKSLNDPYEAFPSINVMPQVNISLQEENKKIDEAYKNFQSDARTEMRDSYKQGFTSQFNNQTSSKNLADTLGDSFGIFSLSRSHSSLLMWAHYASQYTGYVIGFDETKLLPNMVDRSGNSIKSSKVTYSENRNLIEFKGDNWQELISQKPIEWAYEQEERFFMSGMDLSDSIGLDEFGMNIILPDITPSSILKIIIGCKATRETHDSIQNSARKHSLDCEVYDSYVSENEYRLLLQKIT
jgi:hypothetical protein